MRISVTRLAAFGALIATLAIAPSPTGGVGLRVVPGKIEVDVTPGMAANVPVTVSNVSDYPAHVVISTGEYTVDDAGLYHYAQPTGGGTSLAKWIALRPREFDMPPQSFQQVQLSLLVPRGELRGEYAGVIFIQGLRDGCRYG
jgi:hypothetical protein